MVAPDGTAPNGTTDTGETVHAYFRDGVERTTTTVPTTVPETTTTTLPSTTASTTTTTAAPTTTLPADPTGGEAASLQFVNQRRAENGAAALTVDPGLQDMAEDWAVQMASDGQLRHNPGMADGVFALGYHRAGENVGYADSGPATIDNGWWESDGHRRNILDPDFSAVGIAFVVDDNGRTWGCQVFGGH